MHDITPPPPVEMIARLFTHLQARTDVVDGVSRTKEAGMEPSNAFALAAFALVDTPVEDTTFGFRQER